MSAKTRNQKYRRTHRRGFERMTYSEADYVSRKYFGGLRDKVLERDGYKCQTCENKKKLIVHHVDKDKNHNCLNNLITLCRKCHIAVHRNEVAEAMRQAKKKVLYE